MTLNQISPDGSLISAPQGTRNLMMGNRGELLPKHHQLTRPHAPNKPWISCVLKDKAGNPRPKTDVKYTKLFMLDEVTGFAAGHRPCGGCQNQRYRLFLEVWSMANHIDCTLLEAHLHDERCNSNQFTNDASQLISLKDLPEGIMVRLASGRQPHLLLRGKLFPWTVTGYEMPITAPGSTTVHVITPKSIVKTFQAGFPLALDSGFAVHPSAIP